MSGSPDFVQITVAELASRLDSPEAATLQLIDVREPFEAEMAFIEGFQLLPLNAYEDWAMTIRERFDPQAETIVLCHHGMRSAQMCQWLLSQGFTQVYNVMGGIDAYSLRVDPTIPRY